MFLSALRHSISVIHPQFSDTSLRTISTVLCLFTYIFIRQTTIVPILQRKAYQLSQKPDDKMAEPGFKSRIFSPILKAHSPQNTIT